MSRTVIVKSAPIPAKSSRARSLLICPSCNRLKSVGDQPLDRQGVRPHHPGNAVGYRQRSDPVADGRGSVISGSTSSGPGPNCEIDVVGLSGHFLPLSEAQGIGITFHGEPTAGRADLLRISTAA